MDKTFLSKTSFIKGLQCPKQLWLYKHHPEWRDPVSPHLQALFETGHAIGEQATALFPGGQLVPCEQTPVQAQVATTRSWIGPGVGTLYEAAFLEQNVFARVDILHRGPEGWELYEVKSSTRLRKVYLQDVALQAWVLQQAGLVLSKVGLVLLDQPPHPWATSAPPRFVTHDLTGEVQALQTFIQAEIVTLQGMLQRGGCPAVATGPQCSRPYRCQFHGHCHTQADQQSEAS